MQIWTLLRDCFISLRALPGLAFSTHGSSDLEVLHLNVFVCVVASNDVCHNFARVNQQYKVYLKTIGLHLSEASGQLDMAQLFHTFSAIGLDVSHALRLPLFPFYPLIL